MTTLQARRLLGKKAKSMNDPEVQKLLSQLYSLAEIISDMVSIRGSNKQLGVIDSNIKEVQNGVRSSK